MITPGLYRHHKGGRYRVLFVAEDSTNVRIRHGRKNRMVVYVSLEKGKIWVRDLKEFEENVTVRGKKMPRFARDRTA